MEKQQQQQNPINYYNSWLFLRQQNCTQINLWFLIFKALVYLDEKSLVNFSQPQTGEVTEQKPSTVNTSFHSAIYKL